MPPSYNLKHASFHWQFFFKKIESWPVDQKCGKKQTFSWTPPKNLKWVCFIVCSRGKKSMLSLDFCCIACLTPSLKPSGKERIFFCRLRPPRLGQKMGHISPPSSWGGRGKKKLTSFNAKRVNSPPPPSTQKKSILGRKFHLSLEKKKEYPKVRHQHLKFFGAALFWVTIWQISVVVHGRPAAAAPAAAAGGVALPPPPAVLVACPSTSHLVIFKSVSLSSLNLRHKSPMLPLQLLLLQLSLLLKMSYSAQNYVVHPDEFPLLSIKRCNVRIFLFALV